MSDTLISKIMNTSPRRIDTTVGQTIWQQLGGRRFSIMTGAKDIAFHDNGISFKIGRNSTATNRVSITLDPSDTYIVEFQKVSFPRVNTKGEFVDGKVKVLHKAEDIYCDMLRDCFTNFTGLYTSF
jgi:hypothetical protein